MLGILSTPARPIGDVFALVDRAAPGYEAHLSPYATLALSGDADVTATANTPGWPGGEVLARTT